MHYPNTFGGNLSKPLMSSKLKKKRKKNIWMVIAEKGFVKFVGREGVISLGQSAGGKITTSVYTLYKQSVYKKPT